MSPKQGVLAASRRNHLASTENSRSKRDLMTAPAAISPIFPRSRGPERAYRATTGAQHMCHNPSRAVPTQDHAGVAGSASRERCPKCRLHDGHAGRLNNNSRSRLVCMCFHWCSKVGHQPFQCPAHAPHGRHRPESLSHEGRSIWPASLWLLSFRRTARVVR